MTKDYYIVTFWDSDRPLSDNGDVYNKIIKIDKNVDIFYLLVTKYLKCLKSNVFDDDCLYSDIHNTFEKTFFEDDDDFLRFTQLKDVDTKFVFKHYDKLKKIGKPVLAKTLNKEHDNFNSGFRLVKTDVIILE